MSSQVIKMSDGNKFRSITLKASTIIFLCFLTFSADAERLLRNQRQTIATGLTNTGISFNPMYEGQNSIDPYYDYQPQQQGDIYNTPTSNWHGRDNWKSSYDGYQYGQGATGGGYAGLGLNSYKPTRSYDGYGQGWRGFGAGKDSYSYGRPSLAAYPQRGTKSTYY